MHVCREGGLHLDLRRLDKVELVHNNNNTTAVRQGPGSSWERVLGLHTASLERCFDKIWDKSELMWFRF